MQCNPFWGSLIESLVVLSQLLENVEIILLDKTSLSRTFYFSSHFPLVFLNWKTGQLVSRMCGNPESTRS